MSGFYGADIDQLKQLGRDLAQEGESLISIASRLDAQIKRVSWRGPDSDRFRSEWEASHMVGIRKAAQLLTDASGAANNNARQQEETSSGSAGGFEHPLLHLPMNNFGTTVDMERF